MSLRIVSKKAWWGIALLISLLTFQGAFAQDEEPQPQYTTAEYNAYQKAVEGGPATLLEFITANPDSFLTKQYATDQYLGMVQELYRSGQHAEALEAGEKFLDSVDSENYSALALSAWAAYLTGNWPKAAKYGQAAYDLQPSDDILPLLARSNQRSGNIAKAVPLIEKYCDTVEPKECWDLLPTVTRHHAELKEWSQAATGATKTLAALEAAQKPAEAADDWWSNYVSEEKSMAYTVLGKQAFERKSWAGVEKNYRESLKFNANDKVRRAESYFYIGMSLWNREMIDPAMEAFARGSKISDTPHAKPCREQVERLYKGTHNGSLAGFEEYMDRVTGG